ncbi:hypothetical protein [Ekhidna sp.]|uniref:hypothetical protein n=1 Tax=Ekhidna sp. TaxID=2608089 RepID=UPI003B503121
MPENFLVGDAGGTGTQWRLVKGKEIHQFATIGFNAYTHRVDQLRDDIKAVFADEIPKEFPVYFYSAGVDTKGQALEVSNSLSEILGSKVSVENDLLGVARGLCGVEEGYACILGTGSNACFYDGQNVNKVSASLGYILGDEGSGAHMGKKLLTRIFREQLSKEIMKRFNERFSLTPHKVINRIYHEPQPNHYLASFASFIHEVRHYPEIHQLIIESFNEFFDAFFGHEDSKNISYHFSGSIAYYFADYLREVGNERGILIKNIVQSPISGLVLYHQQNG